MLDYEKVASQYGMDWIDLYDAIHYILASKKGSYIEAQSYQNSISEKFSQSDWIIAEKIVSEEF